jgi:SET domain-containing protein
MLPHDLIYFTGYGVYSTEHFQSGSFLLQYCGEKITEEEAIERMKKPATENMMFFYTHKGKKLW